MTDAVPTRPSATRLSWLVIAPCLAPCVSIPLPAQRPIIVVVPGVYASSEAPNAAFWALSPFGARRQLLIDQRHLQALVGKRIRSIWLRRNAGDAESLSPGGVQLELTLSHARSSSDKPRESFALNRGVTAEVAYSGVVSVPASPIPKQIPAPWRVKIHLQKPFRYTGGTLCVETVTGPGKPPTQRVAPWWPIDAVAQRGGGAVTMIGKSCIPRMGPQPAGVEAAGFTSGSTATLYLRGRTDAGDALCFLGTNSQRWGATPLPMDLRLLGAPGCHVYVELRWALSVGLDKLPDSNISYGSWSLLLPASPSIVGRSIYSQWVVATKTGPFGLATSNGVRAVVGAPTPLTGVSWVESPDPNLPRGRVLRGRFPVLRFEAFAR